MRQVDAPLILSKLRKKLIDDSCQDLRQESIDLYNHIEKTLIEALREHYEQEEQKNTGSDSSDTSKPQRGSN